MRTTARLFLSFALLSAFVPLFAGPADAAATCAGAPGYYITRAGARACFKPDGDVWEAYDRASDGSSAIAWVVANGSSGGWSLVNSKGYDTWAVKNLANLAEGGSWFLIACTQDLSAGGNRFCTRSARTFANNNGLGANVDLNATQV